MSAIDRFESAAPRLRQFLDAEAFTQRRAHVEGLRFADAARMVEELA